MPRINPFKHGLTPEGMGIQRPQKKAVEAALRHAEQTRRESEAEGVELEHAREILGHDILGPEAVEKAFDIKLDPDNVPEIPFSQEDIERAKELGQMLVLRVDQTQDGEPLTMQKMQKLLQDNFYQQGKGKVLNNTVSCGTDPFFTEETPKTAWALVSKDLIPDSTNKNYFEQTKLLIQYLKDRVFKDQQMPREYQEAIEEFEKQRRDLKKLMGKDLQKAAERFEQLKITQLTRHTPVEMLYDMMIAFQNNDERLLPRTETWTSRHSSYGSLVNVGFFGSEGVSVNSWEPDYCDGYIGVSFSRNL
jgi:hypothetical protein